MDSTGFLLTVGGVATVLVGAFVGLRQEAMLAGVALSITGTIITSWRKSTAALTN